MRTVFLCAGALIFANLSQASFLSDFKNFESDEAISIKISTLDDDNIDIFKVPIPSRKKTISTFKSRDQKPYLLRITGSEDKEQCYLVESQYHVVGKDYPYKDNEKITRSLDNFSLDETELNFAVCPYDKRNVIAGLITFSPVKINVESFASSLKPLLKNYKEFLRKDLHVPLTISDHPDGYERQWNDLVRKSDGFQKQIRSKYKVTSKKIPLLKTMIKWPDVQSEAMHARCLYQLMHTLDLDGKLGATMGWVMKKEYRGKGLGKRALIESLLFLFSQTDVKIACASVPKKNTPSYGGMMKIGFEAAPYNTTEYKSYPTEGHPDSELGFSEKMVHVYLTKSRFQWMYAPPIPRMPLWLWKMMHQKTSSLSLL
ncbi:MAG: GNAT family N-acetyltransferase [bacterium]|nr:GNAT family N-acetyltransferase [bacterium]